MKFDEATRIFEVNVREVAEEEGFRRVGFDRGDGWRRLGLGTQVHSRVLAARRKTFGSYRCEVHLQARVPVEEWTAVLTGRLDGCIERESGHWLIEEFKSTDLPSEGIRPSGYAFERDRRQLLAYCYLWKRLGHPRVSAALVYVHIGTGEEISISVSYETESVDRDIERRLAALLRIWKAQAAARARKARAAGRLPFPHTAPRPIQEKLIAAVEQAVRSGENLIAEAPTGSGKTAAVLYPALREGLTSGKQVVFLTSKTLQQKMAVSALQAMNERAFSTLQVRTKEKMCANDRILCHEEFCRFAKNYPEKMARSNILGRLRESYPHLDPDTVFEEARREEVCPFEVQLELAERADAIVGDYNYVFEPGVAMRHLIGEELKDVILLVDEAPEGDAIAETQAPADAVHALRADWEPKLLRYLAWKREMKIALPDDPVMDAHFALHRFAAVLNMWGPDFTCVIERRAAGIRLALICLDPARALAPVFREASSTVLLSATLTPPEAFERVLGLERDRTSSISLPPPFPPENRKVMILPHVRTTYAAREKNYGRIGKVVAEMSDAHSGNDLVLFPSYKFLAEVAAVMPKTRARLLVQRADFSDFERQQILKALASPPPQGILLFAVSGGMYAEGVDYPGELLSGVFVVSPALPQVSFERELLRRYFDEREEAGFAYAYLQPGMTRVVQAAGRLIRSETDRGVIVLMCRRFVEEAYARYLPRDWYCDTPEELVTDRPAEEIREFFESYGSSPSPQREGRGDGDV